MKRTKTNNMTFSRWLLSGRRTITHCIIIYDAIIL